MSVISLDYAPGNFEVVAKLEHYLEEARKGEVGACCIITAMAPATAKRLGVNSVVGSFCGVEQMYKPLREGMLTMIAKLEEYGDNTTPPARAAYADASHALYNCARGSMNFDFFAWLVDAEMTRVREGAPPPLKVHFWFGKDGGTGLKTPFRRQILDKVMRPGLAFVGAIEDDAAIEGRCKEFYLTRDIVAAAKAGEEVPKFTWPLKQVTRSDYVTITLRESEEWPHRNSDLDAWLRFADDLRHQGFSPVFVRDTAKAFERLRFETCPQASIDICERLALYEGAACNLFVSNGPWYLALWGSRPFLSFHVLEEDGHRYECNTPTFWREGFGVAPGEQFPWSALDQQIVWAKDTYENIHKAWAALGLRPSKIQRVA